MFILIVSVKVLVITFERFIAAPSAPHKTRIGVMRPPLPMRFDYTPHS